MEIVGVAGILFDVTSTGVLRILTVRETRDDPTTLKKAGMISIPCGHVNDGETLEEAIVREVFEETGRSVRVMHSAGLFQVNGIPLFAFFLELTSEEIQPTTEGLDPRWLSIEEFFSMRDEEIRPPTREILESLGLPASFSIWGLPTKVLA